MRENVDLKGFGDGFKAFAWVHYYTKIDDLRKELIPGYDPNNLSPEVEKWDRENFEKYFEFHYGKAI